MKNPLPQAFFARDTVTVARCLLGHHLVCWDETLKDHIVCRIVETEAYTQNDPACHAYRGNKGRGATLYKSPGLSYVYFIYGMYHCLNVVTEPEGQAGAVLLRAVEPVYNPTGRHLKTHGPGRLCKALNITKAHNELPLTSQNQPLFLAEGNPVADDNVIITTRIGISVAQDYPWRFYLKGNPWVSVPAPGNKPGTKRLTGTRRSPEQKTQP